MRPASSGADTALLQCEYGALRDHKQAAQFGEAGDHVMDETVGGTAASAAAFAAVDERHHCNGGAARARGDAGIRLRLRRRGCHLHPRRAFGLRARGFPRALNVGVIEPFRVEQAGRRRQVLLALSDTAAARQSVQQKFVDARIEWREREPLIEIPEHRGVGCAFDHMLQQRGVDAAQPAALSGQPTVERRVAVDLEAFEEFALKERGERLQPIGRKGGDAGLRRAFDLDRIDENIADVEPDAIAAGRHAPAAGFVEHASDLTQTPAQLAARIVRNVPQQLA